MSCPFCGAAQGSVPSSEINVQDSAVTGGIHQTTNIVTNDVDEVTAALKSALDEFTSGSEEYSVEQSDTILSLVEDARSLKVKLGRQEEYYIAMVAKKANQSLKAKVFFDSALKKARRSNDHALCCLISWELVEDHLSEVTDEIQAMSGNNRRKVNHAAHKPGDSMI